MSGSDADARAEMPAAAGIFDSGKDAEGSEQAILNAKTRSQGKFKKSDAHMTGSKHEIEISNAMVEVYVERKFHLTGGSVL